MSEEQQEETDGAVWPPPPLRPAAPADDRSFFERVSLWLLAGVATGSGLCSSALYCLLLHWTREPIEWQNALTQGLIVAGLMFGFYLWLRVSLAKRRRR